MNTEDYTVNVTSDNTLIISEQDTTTILVQEDNTILSLPEEEQTFIVVEEEVSVITTEGSQGPSGPAGLSAFDLWLVHNPTGSFEEFMQSLDAQSTWQLIEW